MSEVDSVATFVREGDAFVKRHKGDVGQEAAGVGGLFWGAMRAVAECPNCPDVYRIPIGPEPDRWQRLACPSCHRQWVWDDAPPAATQNQRRKRR